MPEHTPAPTADRAVYGFVLFLLLKTLFILYLIWAIIPESWFDIIHITYLPKQYWAVTVPIFFLTILATFGLVIYPSLSLIMTPSIDDVKTIMDVDSKIYHEKIVYTEEDLDEECICEPKDKCSKKEYLKIHQQSNKLTIPILEDLDIADVSRSLYLNKNLI